MEGSIFPRYAQLLDRFVEVRLHTDLPDPVKEKQFKDYQKALVKSVGLPIYAVVDPKMPDKLLGVFKGADAEGGRAFGTWLEKQSKVDPS
jgi:hypothetical protein